MKNTREYSKRSNDSSSKKPTLYKATCTACKAQCEVPFKPTHGKDIFCSDCFRGTDKQSPRTSSSRDFRKGSDTSPSRPESAGALEAQIQTLIRKIDKLTSLIERSLPEGGEMSSGIPPLTHTKETPKNHKKEVDTDALRNAVKKTQSSRDLLKNREDMTVPFPGSPRKK